MNKKLLFLSVLTLFLVGFFASANHPIIEGQEYKEHPSPGAENRENRKELSVEQRAEQKEERLKKIEERKLGRLKGFWERMKKRLEGAVERFDKLVERIESRMNKFSEEKGKDISAAQAQIEIAKTNIAATSQDINEADAAIKGLLSGEGTAQDIFTEIRGIVKDVRSKLKTALRSLVEALRILRGASVTPVPSSTVDPVASPTPTESPSPTPTPTPTESPTPTPVQ